MMFHQLLLILADNMHTHIYRYIFKTTLCFVFEVCVILLVDISTQFNFYRQLVSGR